MAGCTNNPTYPRVFYRVRVGIQGRVYKPILRSCQVDWVADWLVNQINQMNQLNLVKQLVELLIKLNSHIEFYQSHSC